MQIIRSEMYVLRISPAVLATVGRGRGVSHGRTTRKAASSSLSAGTLLAVSLAVQSSSPDPMRRVWPAHTDPRYLAKDQH